MHDVLLRLAIATPLYRQFDYLCPMSCLIDGKLPQLGCRVLAPFGRQKLIGVVVAHVHLDDCQIPTTKLRPIISVLDDEPILDDFMLTFAHWLASYYHYPLGETLTVMLPTLINQGKPLPQYAPDWHITPQAHDDDFVAQHISNHAKKQRLAFDAIAKLHPSQTQLPSLGIAPATLRTLAQKGLIEPRTPQTQAPKNATVKATPPILTDEQSNAVQAISTAQDEGVYQGFLLNGITGSGKTEVYLQCMWHALQAGKQVLLLVPEIGLTPQTRHRFVARFDANICVLHSKMTDSERLQGWQDCRTGIAQIIIGTRSSVLYDFDNLGLIIIDEAHDQSYKQQDHLRYHACDVALWRGHRQQIPVILGTATPSLEHLKLAQDGKLTELKLTQRANATPASLHLIDLKLGTRYAMLADGQMHPTALSDETVRHIRRHLESGHQVLLFLNRRGYAPMLLCSACGWQADCPSCDAHLTLHKMGQYRHLKCHHCGYHAYAPTTCPECHSANMDDLGAGTAKLGEQLHALFANPQMNRTTYPILQIDADTMRRKGAWESMYQHILTGEPAVLVGTQMIAKGHHFPNVTLVVIVNADLGMLSADFRSPEHTAQQIIQVAGRAGRSQHTGTVLIQTACPTNPLLQTLCKYGYQSFADTLMQERKLLGFPPFSHAALVSCQSHDLTKARTALSHAMQDFPRHDTIAIHGPVDAPMTKKNNWYYVQCLILSKDRQTLHQALNQWWQHALDLPSSKGVRLSLDIDPMHL